MQIHNITPDYVRGVRDMDLGELDLDDGTQRKGGLDPLRLGPQVCLRLQLLIELLSGTAIGLDLGLASRDRGAS